MTLPVLSNHCCFGGAVGGVEADLTGARCVAGSVDPKKAVLPSITCSPAYIFRLWMLYTEPLSLLTSLRY